MSDTVLGTGYISKETLSSWSKEEEALWWPQVVAEWRTDHMNKWFGENKAEKRERECEWGAISNRVVWKELSRLLTEMKDSHGALRRKASQARGIARTGCEGKGYWVSLSNSRRPAWWWGRALGNGLKAVIRAQSQRFLQVIGIILVFILKGFRSDIILHFRRITLAVVLNIDYSGSA